LGELPPSSSEWNQAAEIAKKWRFNRGNRKEDVMKSIGEIGEAKTGQARRKKEEREREMK